MVKKQKKKNFLGFTLVEILIALTLIGLVNIFSAIYAPVQLQKTRDSVRKSNIDTVKKAIEEYYQDKNCYPQTIPTCTNSLTLGNLNLLDSIPCDPSSKLSYVYVPEISNCPSWYQLYARLEYTDDSIIDKIGCRNGCGPDCQYNYGASSPNQKLNPYCQTEIDNTQEEEVVADPDQYVCSKNGNCEIYADPNLSGCPDVYLNDPTCQNACSNKENRCHDARGKMN